MKSTGSLAGVRIVEFEAIGPAPYAVMLLADMGAEVLRIARPDAPWPDLPIVTRGRASLQLDLKDPAGLEMARSAIAVADVVVEGFRPGVMERLGLGPETMQAANPRLIYARMTGWGQEGPLAQSAGHDINFVALGGILGLLGRDGAIPQAPLNLLGDYAGGSLFMVIGVLAALFEREQSGRGQIIDAAIVDGAVSLLAPILAMARAGVLGAAPADGMLSGGAAYYGVYRCADRRDLAVGPLEPKFRRALTDALGLAPGALDGDAAEGRALLTNLFASRPRNAWRALFDDPAACVTPVLSIEEAMADPHLMERAAFAETEAGKVPMPAPRFSRSHSSIAPTGEGSQRLAAWLATQAPHCGGAPD
jgi:alpha-methylacyl-CoA racemase